MAFGSKVHKLAALLHGKRGAFENADNPQTCPTSCDWLSASLDTLCKVLYLHLERFGDI
jgi:hypothetical protein